MHNWLDRFIGWLSPARALKRAQMRARVAAYERLAYEGAKSGRRLAGWFTSNTGPNAEVSAGADRLRSRSRDLVRNNPFAARGIAAIVGNAIGTGIMARTTQPEIQAGWNRWIAQADADNCCDFAGLQALIARTVVESGECLVRFRPRRPEDGIVPPLQLQILEPDFLDSSKTGPTATGYMITGIQYDLVGRRVGYWLFDRHPGEVAAPITTLASRLIPASEVLHIYRKDRPGQERGVPWLAPVIVRMRDLDEYEEAELVRKKIEACFGAFIVGGDPARTFGKASTDSEGRRIESFEPGMIAYLGESEDVKFATPQPSAGYPEYVRHQLRAISAGLGVPYELLTGDLSQTNYSSIRAGLLEFRRMIEHFRWTVLVHQFCEPVWRRFVSLLRLDGGDVPVTWTPPKFDSVDPLKEFAALQMAVRNGLLTWREVVAQMGYDPDEQIAEIAATNEAWDQAGITLDSDPRKTTVSGAVQKEF